MRRPLVRAALTAVVSLAALLGASALSPASAAPGGSGPYPADHATAASLPNHTIYRPTSLPAAPMPVVVWSNGACSADGTSAANFLREIASHGFLVISNGNPGGSGSSTSAWLTQSMDWAVAENARPQSALYHRLDTSKIGVAGFSCGGIEAYAVSNDPRVTTTAIFSSGLLNDADDYQLRRLDHPIGYFIGGPSDIAYPNAIDDWGKLPAGLPAFMGSLDVGPGGTYSQTNSGESLRVRMSWGDREGYKISDSGDLGVWRKPMSSRAVATVLLNRDGDTATVSTTVSALAPGGAASYAVRHLWSHTGSTSTGTISASVPAQGAAMVLVSGGTRGVPPPSTTSTIRTTTSGRRLDVNGASRTNGTAAIIWDGNGRSNQQWRYNTDGTITAVGSGRCLDLVSSGTANGTRTQIWDCSGAASQKWTRS